MVVFQVTAPSPLHLLRCGRWDRALFGTYALSVGFFEAVPLPALKTAGARQIAVLADVSGVAAALGEAGAREVGRTYWLEPVHVSGGCFHAKFLLLDGPFGIRLAVGSGNLTYGGWGRNLEMLEILSPTMDPQAFQDMATFLEALANSDRVSFARADILFSWIESIRALPSTRPSLGAQLLHNVELDLAQQLLEKAMEAGGANKLTVAAPYFGGSAAVRELASALEVEGASVHIAQRLTLNGHHFPFDREPMASRVQIETLIDPGGRPMHAKLLEIDCQEATILVSGSANASVRALLEAGNVELVVARRTVKTLQTFPYLGPLPELPAESSSGSKENGAVKILAASLIGRNLKGVVLGGNDVGQWDAMLDAEGRIYWLGEVLVGEDGSFQATIPSDEQVAFGSRRAVLSLKRENTIVRGFVTFPDLIEINRRWGSGAGNMVRVISGSQEDEDVTGMLEYFAQHPEQTAQPWRSAPKDKSGDQAEDTARVLLDDLSIRPDPTTKRGGVNAGVGHGATAIDRLLAALKKSIVHGKSHRWDTGNEPGDPPTGPKTRRQLESKFDAVRIALAARVPDDPLTELHRLGDIGVYVLARTPEPERVIEFAEWWSALAAAHLRLEGEPTDLTALTVALVLLNQLPGNEASRARAALARIIDDVNPAVKSAKFEVLPSRLQLLIADGSPGSMAFDDLRSRVLIEDTAIEQAERLWQLVQNGEQLPEFPLLDRTPEMAIIRRGIAKSKLPTVVAPGATLCPVHSIRLPDGEIRRLSVLGIASAAGCCSRPLLMVRCA